MINPGVRGRFELSEGLTGIVSGNDAAIAAGEVCGLLPSSVYSTVDCVSAEERVSENGELKNPEAVEN
jgi:hypothetical protein